MKTYSSWTPEPLHRRIALFVFGLAVSLIVTAWPKARNLVGLIFLIVCGAVAAQGQATYMPVCSGNATADTAALTSLKTLVGSTNPATIQFPAKLDPAKLCKLTSITLTPNITVDFTRGGVQVPTGQAVTIQGPIIAGPNKIFYLTGTGIVSFTGNQVLTTIYPQWWGAKADNSTDNLTMFAATKAAWITGWNNFNAIDIQFPPGRYFTSAATNWAHEDITLRAMGQVIIRSTSVGNVMEFDGVATNIYNCHLVGDWVLDGSGVAAQGLYVRNVHHSDFNVRPRNVITNGLRTDGTVLNDYRLKVSSLGDPSVTVQPLHGVTLSNSSLIGPTTACKFYLTVEYTLGTGVVLTSAQNCTFYGTAESCNGFGVTIAAFCILNTFDTFFCEENLLGDFEISGDMNTCHNCSTYSGNTPRTAPKTVTSVTRGATTLISTAAVAHNLAVGQIVILDGFSSTLGTALNGLRTVVAPITSTTFTVNVDTSAASPYVSGAGVNVVGIFVKAGTKQTKWFGGHFWAASLESTADSTWMAGYQADFKIVDSSSNPCLWGLQAQLSGAILPSQCTTLTVTKLLTQGEGATLTSATTITPTHSIHQVSGTATVSTINVPSPVGFPTTTGITIAFVPLAAFHYDNAGNILGSGTAVVGRTMFATYSMSTGKWTMSY